MCIYIYTCAVESKTGPRLVFSNVKNWSQISVFFTLFGFFETFLLSARRMRYSKNEPQKGFKLDHFHVKNWSIIFAQHVWTNV